MNVEEETETDWAYDLADFITAAKHLEDHTLPKMQGADYSALRLILNVLAQYYYWEKQDPNGRHARIEGINDNGSA